MFKLIAPITKAVKNSKGQLVVRGVASDPTIDRDEERFSEEAVKKMHDTLKKGGIPIRVEHQNKFFTDIGEWGTVDIEKSTGKMIVEGVVDTALSLGKDLEIMLNKGAEIALSVGGNILDAGYEYSEELRKHIKVYKDVALQEISVVKNPSNYNATLSMVKSVDWVGVSKFGKTEKAHQAPHTTEAQKLIEAYRNKTKATEEQVTEMHEAFRTEDREIENSGTYFKTYEDFAEKLLSNVAKCYDCFDPDENLHEMSTEDLNAIKELVKFVDAVQIDKDAPRPVEYDDYDYWDSLPTECFIQLPNMVRVLPHHNKDYALNPSQLAYAIKEAVDAKSHYTPKTFSIIINHLFCHAKEAGMLKAAKNISPSNPKSMTKKSKKAVAKGTAPSTAASEALMAGKELGSPTASGKDQGKSAVSPKSGVAEAQAAIDSGAAPGQTPGGGKHEIQDAATIKETVLSSEEFSMMKAANDFQEHEKDLPESMDKMQMTEILKYVRAYKLVESALKGGNAFQHEDGSVTLKTVQREATAEAAAFSEFTPEVVGALTKEKAVELLSRISKGEFATEASDQVEALETAVLSHIQSNPEPMHKQVKKDAAPADEAAQTDEEKKAAEEAAKAEETPAEEAAAEETPAEEAPAEEKAAEEAPAEEAAKEETPAEEAAAEEAPAEEAAKTEEVTPAAKEEENPATEAAVETPAEEATPAEAPAEPAGDEAAKAEEAPAEPAAPEAAPAAPEAPAAETPASAEEVTKAISESSQKLEKTVGDKLDTIAKAFTKQSTETVAKAEQALKSVSDLGEKFVEIEKIIPLVTKMAELQEKMSKSPTGRRAISSYVALEKSAQESSASAVDGVLPADAVQKLADEIMDADPKVTPTDAYKQAKDKLESPE